MERQRMLALRKNVMSERAPGDTAAY
jgi:hypothetical protein